MIKAAAYMRFSCRPNADQCDSIEWQKDFIFRWARERGRVIEREFSDEDVSGCSTANRGGLSEAIAYCKSQHVEMVAYSLSRVARNLRDMLNTQWELAQGGSRLVLLDQPDDLESDSGELSLIFNGYMAQKFLKDLRRATSAGMQKKQREGLRMSGHAPFGFCFSGDALQPLPAEQAILVTIYGMADSGASAASIRAFLTDSGETFRGAPWRTRSVERVLRRRLPISPALIPQRGRCSA